VAHAIFISYRRDDTEGEAGRLFSDLKQTFGKDGVFMDVADIRPGADFRRVIDNSVAGCGVLLAVIGPNWLTIADADGHRRIDNPNDFVGLEIGSALKRDVPVIPVLVHGAHMPPPEQLPADLRDLSFRNSVEISHARWDSDVALLIEALKSYASPSPASEHEPVHATVPVQLPPPHSASMVETVPAKKSKRGLILGVAAAVVVLVILIFAFSMGSGSPSAGNQPAVAPRAADDGKQASSEAQTAATAALPQQPGAQPAAGAASLVGRWNDADPRGGNSLYLLDISAPDNKMQIHAWGACGEHPCDWGTQSALSDGTTASAIFNLGQDQGEDRIAAVSVHRDGANLDVKVVNTFTSSSGSRKNHAHRTFIPSS